MRTQWQFMTSFTIAGFCGSLVVATPGCSARSSGPLPAERVDVSPATQPGSPASVRLEPSTIQPIYREILAIDLPSAISAARAGNLEILRARQQVEASRGRWESTMGGAFPTLAPGATFDHVDGTVRAVQGNLVGAAFNTFQPVVAVQWVLNPGQVVYDMIAARKKLAASEHQEQAVILETLRRTISQYYELVLSQARVATARQAVVEAEELLRINQLRGHAGTAVPADVLRAEARLAERQQDLIRSVNVFHETSVSLAVTLRLDSTITLIPKGERFPAITLVRRECSLDDLLGYALMYRPDLKAVRSLVEAAASSRKATWWGDLGPQFQVGYQFGGITGHADGVTPAQGIPNNLIINPLAANGSFSPSPLVNGIVKEGISRLSQRAGEAQDQTAGFSDQERFSAGVGWRFSVAVIGDMKTARAVEQQAAIEADRQLDQVKAQVIVAWNTGRTYGDLIPLAERQLASAEEALRLTQANLRAGTMTTLDVLQAEDATDQARFRQAETVIRCNQAQIDLLAALGLLDEDEVKGCLEQVSSQFSHARD